MKAILIKPYGQFEVIETEPKIEQFQQLIGGYIEPIYKGDYVLLVDEEGKIKELPENILGLVGNILIVRRGNDDFESLTSADINKIIANIKL